MQEYQKQTPIKYEDTFGFYHNLKKTEQLFKQAVLYAVLSATLIAAPSFLNIEPTCIFFHHAPGKINPI